MQCYKGYELTVLAGFYRAIAAHGRLAAVQAELAERARLGVPDKVAREAYEPPCVRGGMAGQVVDPAA